MLSRLRCGRKWRSAKAKSSSGNPSIGHRADDRALFLCDAPGQTLRSARSVLACLLTAPAPFSDRLVADAVALYNSARRLNIARSLLTQPVWFVPGDRFASSQHLIAHKGKAPRVIRGSPTYLIPMTFRIQTARQSRRRGESHK
jgi:hypothetical protein